MNSDQERLLLQAIRRGDKKALFVLLRARMLEYRVVCQHCGKSVMPRSRSYDFDVLALNAECSLCGKMNRLPMKEWDGIPPLQPPPAA